MAEKVGDKSVKKNKKKADTYFGLFKYVYLTVFS